MLYNVYMYIIFNHIRVQHYYINSNKNSDSLVDNKNENDRMIMAFDNQDNDEMITVESVTDPLPNAFVEHSYVKAADRERAGHVGTEQTGSVVQRPFVQLQLTCITVIIV